MKKILLSMLTAVTTFMTASAQDPVQATDLSALTDAVYVVPQEAPAGSQQTLSVCMKNSIVVQTIQFDLYLPDGLTVVLNEDEELMTPSKARINKFNFFQSSVQETGAIRLLAQATTTNIAVGDGEIATIKVAVDGDMTQTSHPIAVKDILLVSPDNTSPQVEDVVTMITIVEPQDNRIVLNENSTTAPAASDGAVDVLVNRTIYANQWSTICLPFAMTAEQIAAAFGSEVTVELGDFKGYTVTEDDNEDVVGITINFDEATAIEANHPYIIKVSAPVTQFTVDGVTIAPSDNPRVSFGTNKKPKDFIGTFVADYDFYNAAKYTPLFLSGNKIYYATENTQHIMAFRAFFDFVDELSDIGSSASRVTMSFNDEATGIAERNARLDGDGSDRTYTLQGLPVSTPRKGLYIREGKKVIIK